LLKFLLFVRYFCTCVGKFWIAKLSNFPDIIYSTDPHVPSFSSIFPLSFAKSLLYSRTHRHHPLLQLIRKPIYCQSRSVEWLASWISARLLNTCNSLFSFSLACAFATQAARRYDLIHLSISSFSWLTVCGWIVMPFTWI